MQNISARQLQIMDFKGENTIIDEITSEKSHLVCKLN